MIHDNLHLRSHTKTLRLQITSFPKITFQEQSHTHTHQSISRAYVTVMNNENANRRVGLD